MSLVPRELEHQSRAISALSDCPSLIREILQALAHPVKEPGYTPKQIDIYFEDVLVMSQVNSRIRHELKFLPDYVPDVIAIYGDRELIFVKAKGEVILSRLPSVFIKGEWSRYAKS